MSWQYACNLLLRKLSYSENKVLFQYSSIDNFCSKYLHMKILMGHTLTAQPSTYVLFMITVVYIYFSAADAHKYKTQGWINIFKSSITVDMEIWWFVKVEKYKIQETINMNMDGEIKPFIFLYWNHIMEILLHFCANPA